MFAALLAACRPSPVVLQARYQAAATLSAAALERLYITLPRAEFERRHREFERLHKRSHRALVHWLRSLPPVGA